MTSESQFDRDNLTPPSPEWVGDDTIETVVDVLNTMQENGMTNEETLERIGRRIVSLIHHGGLTPSEAKVKATREALHPGRNLEEIGRLLGISKSGVSNLSTKARESEVEASRLRVMTMDSPLNVISEMNFDAEPPADFHEKYYLLEFAFPHGEKVTYTSRGPDVEAPDPKYAVYVEQFDPHKYLGYTFSGSDLTYYLTKEDLVEDMYEDETFWTEERAADWARWLESCGFPVESDPSDRVDPLV